MIPGAGSSPSMYILAAVSESLPPRNLVEKSTVNYVLVPLARLHGLNLQTSIGEISHAMPEAC